MSTSSFSSWRCLCLEIYVWSKELGARLTEGARWQRSIPGLCVFVLALPGRSGNPLQGKLLCFLLTQKCSRLTSFDAGSGARAQGRRPPEVRQQRLRSKFLGALDKKLDSKAGAARISACLLRFDQHNWAVVPRMVPDEGEMKQDCRQRSGRTKENS